MKSGEAVLILEDGRAFPGFGVGASGEAFGEVVFNTSMTGYQEILSDPSYCGQIVAFTAPQIGNYGVTRQDLQADRPALSGMVVRELSPTYSNHRSEGALQEWLAANGVVGISGVDTRALTRHLRERGAMRGVIAPGRATAELLGRVERSPSLVGRDLTGEVTTRAAYDVPSEGAPLQRVALIDFGVKRGILRCLTHRGLEVRVLPASATPADVLAVRPSGLVLSNGPGDPAAVRAGIACAHELIGRLPILGICLGHQILGLALGAKTLKLRFGHHGGNHPVLDGPSGAVWITAQNHGFAVDPDTLPGGDVEITHRSLYDGTLEGFASVRRKLIAVQFHPEGCPGPSDAASIFDRFVGLLEKEGGRAQAY
jgi:carbamoyl-phosphate synthase small subunit